MSRIPGKKLLICFSAAALILVFICRAGLYPVGQRTLTVHPVDPRNLQSIDSAIGLLHTGDVVLRTGADVTSYIFSQMNQSDKRFSHCGLVVMEQGTPYIYDCIGGEDNPDQKLRRQTAAAWFSPSANLGLGIARYALDSAQLGALTRIIRRSYREGKKFDMAFDLRTDDRLYCAEFVYKALNEAVKDQEYIQPVTVLGYTFVGVDNLFCNRHAKLICQLQYK